MKKKLIILSMICFGFGANAQWIKQNTNFSRSLIVNNISIVDANTVWATAFNPFNPGTTNHFTRTTDGGTTWVSDTIDGANRSYVMSDLSAISSSIAYAALVNGTTLGGAVYKTTDAGTTWLKVSSANMFTTATLGYPDAIHFFNTNNGVAIGDNNTGFEIWTTADGGTSWTPAVTVPVIIAGEYPNIAETSVVGNTIWIGTNKGRVLKSIDMGANWLAYATGVTNAQNIAFKDALNGLVTDTTALYSTNDGGLNWTIVNYSGPMLKGDITYMPGTAGTYITVGSETGAAGTAISYNDGTTWKNIHSSNRYSVSFLDQNTGWSGDLNYAPPTFGGIFKWSSSADDAGVDDIMGPTNGCNSTTTHPVTLVIKNYGSNTLSSFKIHYKKDSGTPTQTISITGKNLAPFDTMMYNISGLNFTSRYAQFKAWTTEPNGPNTDSNPGNDTLETVIDVYIQETASVPSSFDFSQPLNNFWCKNLGPNGVIDTNTVSGADACGPGPSLVSYVQGINSFELKIDLSPLADTKRVMAFDYGATREEDDSEDGIYLNTGGTDVMIYDFDLSIITSCTHLSIDLDSAAAANSLDLNSNTHIIWKIKGTRTPDFTFYHMDNLSFTNVGIVGTRDVVINSFLVEQNQPNPGQEYTKINYSTSNAGNVSLEIHNLLGEKVYSTVQYATAGNNSMDINLNKFEAGTYFYTLKNGIESSTKKMIVIK